MSEQQILRLLATLREEVAHVRSRQEELYEVLVSYKDQLHDLKKTVTESLEGLPKSPYIAGQLVPAPHAIGGVDAFAELVSTYLHKGPQVPDDPGPVDARCDPPPEVSPEEIELEPDPDRSRRGRRRGPRVDPDLARSPDRDIVPLDLEGDDGKKKKKRRSRSRKKKKKQKAAPESEAVSAED
ncbi:MAG: hypothetical protein D6731_04995 [Planctomycetota bacterium]|nr:MAG: hypothetical protein D6731_04995 [Planctomycetota bacterium]